jgi:PAS domain S-box-containing protein
MRLKNPLMRTGGGVPLRLFLLLPFTGITAAAIVAIGLMSFLNGQRSVETLSRRLLCGINGRATDHLMALMQQPPLVNAMNAMTIARGYREGRDLSALQSLLAEESASFPILSSIGFGAAGGGLVEAGRDPDGSRWVRKTDGEGPGDARKAALDAEGGPTTAAAVIRGYDSRARPWYTAAVEADGPAWTQPFVQSSGQDMAIAASVPARDPAGRLLGVAVVQLSLSRLDEFLKSMPVGSSGHCFIMQRDGRLISSSGGPLPYTRTADGRIARMDARRSVVPSIKAAAEAIDRRFAGLGSITRATSLSARHGSGLELVEVTPFTAVAGMDWLVVSVIPDAEVMGDVYANTRSTLAATLIALILTVGVGALLARTIADPILSLNAHLRGMTGSSWNGGITGAAPVREIRELTTSFNDTLARLHAVMRSLTAEVAERTQAEAALRRSEGRLRLVVDQSTDGIILTDETGIVMEWSPAMERVTGIPAERTVGRPMAEAQLLLLPAVQRTPEMERRIRRQLAAFQLSGTLSPAHAAPEWVRLARTDGSTVAAEVSFFPIRTREGFMLGGLVRDVTQRLKAEQEREALITELRTALRQVKQLSGLLPICSGCKKICDDKGYWHQVEVYIHDHADVDFSHSLCPDCARKYFTGHRE